MKRGYGQYCPLALASELLGQRWTVLVISRVIDGCTTFNEIHRGLPRIAPSMLSRRLVELEDAGIISRRKRKGRTTYTYHPTAAGKDLEDIIENMSIWGQHWARDMSMDDLDSAFLAWSMHLRLNTEAMPPGRTVLEFDFANPPEGNERFWLVNEDGDVDMCLKHPGFDTDLLVESNLRRFVETWRGFRDLGEELRSGQITLTGPRQLKRAFPTWLLLSTFAPYARKRPGLERRLSKHC